MKIKLGDAILPHGMIRGPFGSALKKSLLVSKSENNYKVYEQGVVLEKNSSVGNYYVTSDYFNKMKRFAVQENDFLVSCSGVNYGAVYQIKGNFEPGIINQALLILRINPVIADYNYFLYYFKSFISKSITIGTGDSTIPNFPSVSVIKNIELDLPPLDTQRKIGNFLYALDDKIALNKKINATLEAMAKTLYDYWFVQFDFPDENGKPYKSSGGKMIYSSELGRDIPVGWEVQRLSDIATIIQGNSPNGSTLNDTGEGMIFFQGKTDFGFRFPEVRIYTTAPYRLAEKFDTLLSVRAPVGDVNMAHEKCCIGRGLATIHSDFPSFVYYMLKKLKPRLEKLGSIGTTFDSITKDDVIALKINMPSKKLVKKFENIVSKFDEEIFKKTDESRRLAELRDWLLPMLMNGQIGCKEKI